MELIGCEANQGTTDCRMALGLEDGSIPDSAITISKTWDPPAKNVWGTTLSEFRLGSRGEGLCFDTKKYGEGWIQIDMGKVSIQNIK